MMNALFMEGKMVLIGICDDVKEERQKVYDLCESFFARTVIEHKYVIFSSGEEVLTYCDNGENLRVDLLFLDVEMNGISGIELKDAVMKQSKVWRIAFVSNHAESIFDAYGIKTIGFVSKPPVPEKIEKMISITLDEMKEDVIVTINGYKSGIIEIRLEDILYFKADGSYTEIYTYKSIKKSQKYILSTKKIGEIEAELKEYPIIRVHKSYMVNIENVTDIDIFVSLRDIAERIPVGRAYKEAVKCSYYKYGKNRIKKRL